MRTIHQPALRAGAAEIDITPPSGTHLAGSGAGEHRPAQSILDPLYVKALVLESGADRICILGLDITIITEDYTTVIRAGIHERTGIPPEAIMVHAIQTHSAPSLGHFMLDPDFPLETNADNEYLRGAESPYSEATARSAIQAGVTACERLQPARLGVGRGMVGNLAFNRRGISRSGSIIMPKPQGTVNQPLGLTDLCCLEGPIDPEVGVVCIQDMTMRPLAFLLHHSCHPVNVFGNPQTYYAISSDWPGAWCQQIKAVYGAQTVPIVLNGCCGNLNPWNPFDPDDTPDHRRMGRHLTSMTERIVPGLTFHTDIQVDWRCQQLSLPYRDIPAARHRDVADILAAHPQPRWRGPDDIDPTWFRAASTRSVELCRRRAPEFAYEIQAFRIGDVAVVGLPGEPFVEGQLALKTASPAPFIHVAHLTTHYVGYLPTREAYTRGGHEANVDVTYWAKLAPGCLEQVIDAARASIEELFPAIDTPTSRPVGQPLT